MVEPHRPQMTIGRMRFACRITKTTDKHSEYVSYCFSMATVVDEHAVLLLLMAVACTVRVYSVQSVEVVP
jgi:hypothetical protein